MHTTNYFNTFISIAEDSPASTGEEPPRKGDPKTVATIQFDMLKDEPYKYTSDDVVLERTQLKTTSVLRRLKRKEKRFSAKARLVCVHRH